MWLVHRHSSTSGILPSLQALHPSRSAGRGPRTQIKPHARQNNPQQDSPFSPNQIITIVDDLLSKSEEDLEQAREIEATLQRYRIETPALRGLIDGCLDIVQGNVTKELKWLAALRASRTRLQQLPPDVDFFTIVNDLVDNTPEVQALAETYQGALAVTTTLSKIAGAWFFCWWVGLLTPADAYHLWGFPLDPTLATWAAWTTPCVALALLLVVSGQVDDTQAVRPVPQEDDRAVSSVLVKAMGPLGSVVVAGGCALAAGLVFRGVWLDLLTTTVFSPPDVSAVFDPDLGEAAIMRSSFGTLLPAAPSLPIPPVLLGLGACASVATVETLYRVTTALVSDAEVQDDEIVEPGSGQTEVLNDNNEWVSVSIVEGSDTDPTVTLVSSVRTSCVAAEWALCALLCAETLATQSLLMSVGTHAACILVTTLALNALGGDDDDDESEAPATPQPAAAQRDA